MTAPFRTAAAALVLASSLGLALVGVPGSAAFYTDTDAADGNALDGGSLDPKLTESGPTNGYESTTDENESDVVYDTWEDTAHDTLGTHNVSNTLTISNAESTLSAEQVDIVVEYAENDSSSGDGNSMNTSRTIVVEAFAYAGEDLTGTLSDENGDGNLDLDDLTRGSNVDALSGLSGVSTGGTANLTVAFSGTADLIDGVGSGDGVDVTVTIRGANTGFADADVSKNNTIRYA